MRQLFLDDTIVNQYSEKMKELETNGIGKRKRVNPWGSDNTNQVFKHLPISETKPDIAQPEYDQIGHYFDEYVLPAYDFTPSEAESLREEYINTFKSMVGDISFTEWLEMTKSKIKPRYLFGTEFITQCQHQREAGYGQ